MDAVDRQHYNTGWNDIANGILTWTGSDKWQSPLEWAIEMRTIALAQRGNDAYMRGCVECVEAYQKTGRIERKEKARWL